jgi:hypothetical protein
MTVRDSITRTRARTPGVEDDPTSTTVRDRALGPTQCGISDVATKCTKGGRKPNICRCMLGAVLSWRCLGRHRLRCQPCSRIGENPPYGMIGGIEETSASSRPDPRLDPTRLRGALSNERPYRDLRNVGANYPFERSRRFAGIQPKYGHRDCSRLSCGIWICSSGLALPGSSASVLSHRDWPRFLPIQRCSAGGQTNNTIAHFALDFERKESVCGGCGHRA